MNQRNELENVISFEWTDAVSMYVGNEMHQSAVSETEPLLLVFIIKWKRVTHHSTQAMIWQTNQINNVYTYISLHLCISHIYYMVYYLCYSRCSCSGLEGIFSAQYIKTPIDT